MNKNNNKIIGNTFSLPPRRALPVDFSLSAPPLSLIEADLSVSRRLRALTFGERPPLLCA